MGAHADSSAADDKPDIATIHIDFTSTEGINNFTACKLGSFRTAQRRLDSAREVLQQRNLYAAQGSLNELAISGKCRGMKDETYQVEASFESQLGDHIDWATVSCTCPSCEREGICKHVVAIILASCLHPDTLWAEAQRLQSPPKRQPAPALEAAAAGGAAGSGSAAAAAATGAGQGSQPGGARRRKLPSSLLQDAGPAAAPTGRAPPKPKPPAAAKPKPPPKPRAPRGGAGGGKRKAAAAADPAPLVVFARMRGRRLLQDSDQELLRQCRAALDGDGAAAAAKKARPAAGAVASAAGAQGAGSSIRVPLSQPLQQQAQQPQQQQQSQQQAQPEQRGAGPVPELPSEAHVLPAPASQPAVAKHEQQPAPAGAAAPLAGSRQAAPVAPPAAGSGPTAPATRRQPLGMFASLMQSMGMQLPPAPAAAAADGPTAPSAAAQQQAQHQPTPAHVASGLSRLGPAAAQAAQAALQGATYRSDSGNSSAFDAPTQ